MKKIKKTFLGLLNDYNIIKEIPLTAFIIAVGTVLFMWFLVLNLILPLYMPLQKVDLIADIFNKTAIGCSALFAVFGSFRYLERYFEIDKIRIREKMYADAYPIEDFGEDKRYKIIQRESKIGEFYILDTTHGIIRHIGNSFTYQELGWARFDIDTLSDLEFKKFTRGNVILLSGKVGE